VNRWLWNFRHPRNGDVMIFSTTGINGLAQGTHYIKRMCGTPGDTVQIVKPDLFINGRKMEGIRPADCRFCVLLDIWDVKAREVGEILANTPHDELCRPVTTPGGPGGGTSHAH
jgi:hypothetical protein